VGRSLGQGLWRSFWGPSQPWEEGKGEGRRGEGAGGGCTGGGRADERKLFAECGEVGPAGTSLALGGTCFFFSLYFAGCDRLLQLFDAFPWRLMCTKLSKGSGSSSGVMCVCSCRKGLELSVWDLERHVCLWRAKNVSDTAGPHLCKTNLISGGYFFLFFFSNLQSGNP